MLEIRCRSPPPVNVAPGLVLWLWQLKCDAHRIQLFNFAVEMMSKFTVKNYRKKYLGHQALP